MRTQLSRRLAAGSLSAAALVLTSAGARAQQVDVNPPAPNVMLLIDNSGSMERMIDGSLPEDTPANNCNCNPSNGACSGTANPNRWGVMLQALTGSFQNGTNGYNCAAMPRSSGSIFDQEYSISGNSPYDVNYYIPYHRPIAIDTQTSSSGPLSCVYAPGTMPASLLADPFPSNAIINRTYGISGTTACKFTQNTDGALDTQRDLLRFGLMTFDQDPSAAIGVTSGGAVTSPPFTGMWSYFPGWNPGPGTPPTGRPTNCLTPATPMAVGARNPAAPPWEGRMMRFPATTDLLTQETRNDAVGQVLLASRPYGATPLAGMFSGAQYYFQTDPTGPQQADPYVQGGCRKQYIILLTDGAPNLDLRPDCAPNPPGVCPFGLPETTAGALFAPSGGVQKVTTYVIGFAVSQFQDSGSTIYCSNLVNNGTLDATCVTPDALHAPCCELQKIAVNGGSTHAYFADTAGDLQNALGSILSQISQNTTTRTTPAYSPVITNANADPNAPQTNASLFLASFNPAVGQPWSGDVQRQRFVCTYNAAGGGSSAGYTIAAPAPTISAGDDFAANLNSHSGPARTFVLFQPNTIGGGSAVDATATIRPYVTNTVGDGLGKYSATQYAGLASSVAGLITPAALGVSGTSCSYNPIGGGASQNLTAAQCTSLLFDFTLGQQSFAGPANFPFVSRYNNALGGIYHATPAVVGPPSSLLTDDSYVAFAAQYANRLQIVYSATTDGLLHAFNADETKLENNEKWALMPPAVMTGLLSTYPSDARQLLDASPVVKDVVWDRTGQTVNANLWHTMLVAGFGQAQGYYAIDVTNPDPTNITSGSLPADPPPLGPVFRWQLTKMPSTNAPLFGAQQSATPAITSLFMDPGDGGGAREIGVAILPGGQDSGPDTAAGGGPVACSRVPAVKTSDSAPVGAYVARTSVRCWGEPAGSSPPPPASTDPVIGRSLVIARLDTGEILRVFMRLADLSKYPLDTLNVARRITDTALDSPMTGVPIVFPGDVGSDATKVFVGDADGTLWRFDLSSPDPTQWFGELYLDLYNQTVDTSSTSWSDGQPVLIPPVVSLDTKGQVVLNVATGSGSLAQFDATGTYYAYSVSEAIAGTPAKLRASVNWWLNPALITNQPGERVSGPMTVFDGVFYFATYSTPAPGSQSCTTGDARLWGRDFVTPKLTTDLSKGGMPRMQAPSGQPQLNPLPDYIQPDTYDSTLRGVVIPGVSIKATPACAGLGNPTTDSYVAGAQHSSPQNFTPGSYSLFTQVGASSGTGGAAAKQFELPLPTPVSPTMIDSWAAVIE